MITLKQAIDVLGLPDDESVFLCHEHCEFNAHSTSVKEIRDKYDMRHTLIRRIYPYHFQYCDDLNWELILAK